MEHLKRIKAKTNRKVNVQKCQFIIYLFVKLLTIEVYIR